jgi:hypothetical protein
MTTLAPPWQCFENEVFEAVKKALSAGYFPFDGETKVVRAADYPGLTPGSTIKIEVALEAYRSGATEPFLIWLWECKDKSARKVDVGEVRELHSKLQEIGVSRAVGSLVTTNGFQKGAIELAKKLGISLYLLKKRLIPLLKYEAGAGETLRQVIIAEKSLDFLGLEASDAFFGHAVKVDFGHLLTRMNRKTDSAAAWESLMARLKERPIHGGGVHFTRDELHERR